MDHFDAIAQQMVAATRPQAHTVLPLSVIAGGDGSKWAGGMSGGGWPYLVGHHRARQNARIAMHESVQARAMVERTADIVADGGLRPDFAPVIEVLGISREYAAEWAANTGARFDLWARDKKAHRAEQMNWYQSQALWQLFRHRDNDQFVRLWYENDPELQNPLQFDFIDPDMVRGDAVTTSYGFQCSVDGIERDERGREVRYKVWVKVKKDDSYEWQERNIPAHFGKRRAMLHGFSPEYAGQGRGFTRLAHAVQEFEGITDFSAATIKKAINQSNIVAFTEAKDGDASNPLDEIVQFSQAGPAAQFIGSNPQPVDGLPTQPAAVLASFGKVPEATLNVPGSLYVGNLRKGETIKFPQNSAPGDSFDKFVDSFAGHLSASLKIPLEVVLMKFGQNYSASRATLLLFWQIAMIERQEMATDYLNPVVEAWMSEEIAAGRIVAPGWSDPRMRAAWLNCNWIGAGPPDIDPAKSAKAARENIEIGRTSAESEARLYNGSSAADNVAKNNATYAWYEQLPWNEVAAPQGAAPGATAAATARAFLDEVRMIVREEMDNG